MAISPTGPKILEDLIRSGETLEVEFKDDTRSGFSDKIIYEAVVALANTHGGLIIVGVTNKGKVVGSGRLADGTWASTEAITGMILGNTVPPCPTLVEIAEVSGKKVVLVQVQAGASTTGTRAGKFLRRSLDSQGQPCDVPMTTDDIVRGVARIGVQDFSATVLMDSSIDEIDQALVKSVGSIRASQVIDPAQRELFQSDPMNILAATGLLRLGDGKPNIACMLLFGKADRLKSRLPNHAVQYQVFGPRGEILKNETISDPIATAFPRLLALPELQRNSNEFVYRGATVAIAEYPAESRREALANALVHRDYTVQGGIQLQVFEKELMVTSPGPFPQGVTLQNLLSAPPVPRNRCLAEAMRGFGYVESSGRGIDFIYRGQARYGRPAPDYSESNSSRVSVRLAGGQANLDFCRFIISTRSEPTIPELLLLNALFFRRDLTLDACATVIQKPVQATQEILSRLHQDGLVEITSDRLPRYLLRGSVSQAARSAIKPARMTKAQLEQYSDRLIQEIGRRDSETISVLADVTGLSLSQTRRLLRRLQKSGKVRMLPSRRWKKK